MEKEQGTRNGKKKTAFDEWDRIFTNAKKESRKRKPMTLKKPICFGALSVGTPVAREYSGCEYRESCIRGDRRNRPGTRK
jgi:hypothetical protein